MKPIIAVVLVGVIMVAAGWYVLQDTDGDTVVLPADTATEAEDLGQIGESKAESPEVSEAPTGTGSFATLLALGQALECDYTYTPETGGAIVGTTYVDGQTERVRSDFAMQQAGETYESSMIVRDAKVYTWTTSGFGNFALVTDMSAEESASETEEDFEAVSLDDEVNYSCRPWVSDESVFTLPSDIEFQTMEQMMQARFGDALPAGFEMPGGLQLQ